MIPESIDGALCCGSAIDWLLSCLRAIADRHGFTVLLEEKESLRALFEIASGSSRALKAPAYLRPGGKTSEYATAHRFFVRIGPFGPNGDH